MAIFKVEYNGKCGIVDEKGNIIVPCIYSVIDNPRNGYILVRNLKDKWGVIDETGKVIAPCKYDEIASFSEGMACVEDNGKYGFVNATGNLVIPCIYSCTSMKFHDGLVDVELDGKTGYIDKTGKTIVPFIYNEGNGFRDGLALVEMHGKSFYNEFDEFVKPKAIGYIDTKGNEIIPCDYYPASFEECFSVDAVKKYSDMQTTLKTYTANYKLDHAKTQEEAKCLINKYAEDIESIINDRNIRLRELCGKKDLSVRLDKLMQETNITIQEIIKAYKELNELGE